MMKKLVNFVVLVMFVNVFISSSYAQEIVWSVEENIWNNDENTLLINDGKKELEDVLNFVQPLESLQNNEVGVYQNTTNFVNQSGWGNFDDIDLTNPLQILRNWEIVSTYTWLSQAINEAENGDVINLMKDILVTKASVIAWKSLTINGNNHTITRDADITTLTVNEDSSLKLIDITITDNAANFAPNRYDSLINAKSNILLCLWWVNETRNESWDVTASVCSTVNLDVAKTNPQIYSVGDIYGDNLTISNSLNSKWSAAIIVEKWWIEMINSNFIHNWASGTSNAWRGWSIRVWPNTATNIADESPITKIIFSWCLFENNYARNHWWALSLQYMPEIITIDNCVFSGNTAYGNWWAIHVPNIRDKSSWYLPAISIWSAFPIWILNINDSEFYNNRVWNDGAAIENDDMYLEINWCYFEHNYWTQPLNTSVWVIWCQVWWTIEFDWVNRWLIWRNYNIKNTKFYDSNVIVLGDFLTIWSYDVDSCIFENQKSVMLTYTMSWSVKNSIIKNSNPFGNCGKTWYNVWDIDIVNINDDYENFFVPKFWESTFILKNNTYINDCMTNEYFQIRNMNYEIWKSSIIVDDDTKILVHRAYYDSSNIQWTDEIYYWATLDDGKYTYIKKNKFYNFDEFNDRLSSFSYWNSGYQLNSWKTMLFYLDSGYTELWSGFVSTTVKLYWKETNIYNITYEWMEGVDFEWITHMFKFNNLNYAQYLTEFTPYNLNTPSRNWYRFLWWYLDSGYTIPVTSIEFWTTWDITLYAKWERVGYSGNWDWILSKIDISREGEVPFKPQISTKDDDNLQNVVYSEVDVDEEISDTPVYSFVDSLWWQNYTQEFQQAYEFAKRNWITTKLTIKDAKMDWNLTRIEMAKMLSYYAMNILWEVPDATKKLKFRDVSNRMDNAYDNWVTLSYQLWIMWQNMPNNCFRPNDDVSRAEFVTALSRMLYNTSDWEYKETPIYYLPHMIKLYNEWIVNNTDPSIKERRWYVMIMLMRSLDIIN